MSLVAHNFRDLYVETRATSFPSGRAARGRIKAPIQQSLGALLAISLIAILVVSAIGLRVALWVPQIWH
jgi:hypothetical protein